jgi:hypothetical protein
MFEKFKILKIHNNISNQPPVCLGKRKDVAELRDCSSWGGICIEDHFKSQHAIPPQGGNHSIHGL